MSSPSEKDRRTSLVKKQRTASLPSKLRKELGLPGLGSEGGGGRARTGQLHGSSAGRRPHRGKSRDHGREKGVVKHKKDKRKDKRNGARGGGGGGSRIGSAALSARERMLRDDIAKDEAFQRALAKKLKMKSVDSKVGGVDDGLNDLLGDDIGASMGGEGSDRSDEYSSPDEGSLLSDSGGTLDSEEENEGVGEGFLRSRSQADLGGEPGISGGATYVPPHLRAGGGPQGLAGAVKRKVRGLLNRVAEASVQQIAYEIHSVLASAAEGTKQAIHQLICDELVRAAAEGPRASAQFASVTCGLVLGVSAQSRSSRLLAHFASRVAQATQAARRSGDGRGLHNLVLILVHLFSLGALDAAALYSFLESLRAGFVERDVECIYGVLRHAGCALRTAGPAAMKAFVVGVHERAGEVRAEIEGGLTTKQEILLKSVVDIKNNKQRGAFGRGCHALSPQVTKWLKQLHASERCLSSLSWSTLTSPPEDGSWWLLGGEGEGPSDMGEALPGDQEGYDFARLASEQRMNTDIRRSIFVVLMSSEDYMDAFEKLVGLGLKGPQDREIPRVLLHCCMQEAAYNPYYFHVAKHVIKVSRQSQLSFMFAISDVVSELPQQKSARGVSNLALLVSALARGRLVPFTVIRSMDPGGKFDKKELIFLQVFLEEFMAAASQEETHEQFLVYYMNPENHAMRDLLVIFIKKYFQKYLSRSEAKTKADIQKLRANSDAALKALSGSM